METSVIARTSPGVDPLRGAGAAVAAVLVVWLALVIGLGARGVFAGAPSQPPLAVLLAFVLPLSLFTVCYLGSRRFRAFVLGLDLRLLTAMQAWRVIGGMFLVLNAYALLPGLFAYPAGWGDLAVGASAPFVLLSMLRGEAGWRRRVVWLNLAGLLDFLIAMATGVVSSNNALGFVAFSGAPRADLALLPLSLVPTFGVPLFTIFHLISLLQLRREARAARLGAAHGLAATSA
jgi:hypothetical protein